MPPPFACPRCGAALALPPELTATAVTCRYCGTQQPVPDLAERQRALEAQRFAERQRQQAEAAQREALGEQRRAQRWARWAMLPGLIAGGVGALVGLASVVRALFAVTGAGGALGGLGSAFGWDGKSPLVCTTGQVMELVGIRVSLKGTAIHAKGSCVLKITGGIITADTAIDASDNATVTLTGTTLDAPIAIDASGGATVMVHGGRSNGKVRKSGRATVIGL